MYKWLNRQLEGRSVAEMSILHTLTAAGSLVALSLAFAFVPETDAESDSARWMLFLIALSVWFVFVCWLWIGLAVCAWKSESERLGTEIFRVLQIGVFVIVVLNMVILGVNADDFKALLFVLLAFDVAVAWMAANFLVLAWCARCRISGRTYFEVGSIFGMVALQFWLYGNI